MNSIQKAVLAVLLLGNAVVFFDFFYSEAARSFDVRSFEQRLGEIFPEPTMVPEQFADASLLPEDYFFFHVHDVGEVTDTALLSVYVGYYPYRGLGTASPHDPRVCYPSQGYELLGGSELVPVGLENGAEAAAANRLVVRSNALEEERIVYYWVQEQGKLPNPAGLRPSAIGEIWDRYQAGRSDLVWVRVEVSQPDPNQRLSADWKQRLFKTMKAASAAMR